MHVSSLWPADWLVTRGDLRHGEHTQVRVFGHVTAASRAHGKRAATLGSQLVKALIVLCHAEHAVCFTGKRSMPVAPVTQIVIASAFCSRGYRGFLRSVMPAGQGSRSGD